MSVTIFTAVSLNGIITPAQGSAGESLIPWLGIPPEILEWKRRPGGGTTWWWSAPARR